MREAVLFTHTRWDEAPRIRHQVARLLRDAGHRVLFLERGDLGLRRSCSDPREVEPGIWVARPPRPIHPQLRIATALHHVDAWFVSRAIREVVGSWSAGSGFSIFNFAHDGWWLRAAFPDRRITTIIHDDFEAQSRLPWHGHITWVLRRTCLASDRVLAVSQPLVERLSGWCSPELFLPWAVEPYVRPARSPDRRDLLFWGYVDNALDMSLVIDVAADIGRRSSPGRLLLVGPTQTRGVRPRIAREIASIANIELHGPSQLDSLPLETVLAAVLPYRRSRALDSVTLANKSMQLISRGLPLAISGMPRFMELPFVVRLDGPLGIPGCIDACIAGFWQWQDAMREFCERNAPRTRLEALGSTRP
jgi:hypothetical protein